MKKLFFLVGAVALAAAASAEIVDLNGVSLTVSAKTDINADGYTNSSGTAADLVFDFDEDATLPQTVSGNVRLVKKGAGVLTVPAQLAYTVGTDIQSGFLHVDSDDWLGAKGAPVTVHDGGLELAALSAAHTFLRPFTVAEGCVGSIRSFPSSTAWTLCVTNVCFKKATLKLENAAAEGTAKYDFYRGPSGTTTYAGNGLATGGTMEICTGAGAYLGVGDVFGGANHQTDITLIIRTGALVSSVGSHSPLTKNVILTGGRVTSSGSSKGSESARRVENIVTTTTWKSVDFCGRVTVEPGPNGEESVVDCPNAHLASDAAEAVFDVKEDAVFRVKTQLWPAQGKTGRTLRKVGKGTLVLEKPLNIGGTFYLEEGTVQMSKHAYLGSITGFAVSDGARLVLEDGTVIADALQISGGGFLSTAPVWFDAAQLVAADGTSMPSVPNFGTAGGSFGAFFAGGTKPGSPTYKADGINGLPSLYFRGGQAGDALLLQSYTNYTDKLTVYLVMKWDGWTNDDGTAYKWHGPISMCPRAMSGEDFNTPGAFDVQWGDKFGVLNIVHGNAQACQPGFDGNPTGSEALILRHERSGLSAQSGTWWSDEHSAFKTATKALTEANSPTNRIELISLGGRTTASGGLCNGNRTRMLKGWIGELIVFSRELTADEQTYVESYLKRKWFSSTTAAVEPPATDNGVSFEVNVPADASATLGFDANARDGEFDRTLVKTGAGTLDFVGNGTGFEAFAVSNGVLHLGRPASKSSQAAVWMDATDADSFVLDGETVVSVRNKGSFGGAFAQSPYKPDSAPSLCPLPKRVTDGINGKPAIAFDWNSALAIECPVYAQSPRHFYVYGVFRRMDFQGVGTGKYSCPFSFYARKETASDQAGVSGFHWEEQQESNGSYTIHACGYHLGKTMNAPFVLDCPYVFCAYQAGFDTAYGFEIASSDDPSVATNVLWTSTINDQTQTAAMDVDWLQLGGRLAGGCAPQWYGTNNSNNRMWKGNIGEFIMFDHQISRDQLAELAAYLRKKWLGLGDGLATPPAFLTGAVEGSVGASRALSVASGATVEVEGATQTIGSLDLADGSTVRRTDAVVGEGPELFDVVDVLSAAGTVSLELSSLDKGTDLLKYGTYAAPEKWTLVGPRSRTRFVGDVAADKTLRIFMTGFFLLFR